MKKFSFSMESVLSLRRLSEDEALEALAAAMRAEAAQRDALTEIDRRIGAVLAAPPLVRPDQQLLRQAHLERLESDREMQQAMIAEAAHATHHARVAVQDAQAQRKVIERVRERRLAEWQLEAQRAEERTLGEVAQAQAHRRRLEEAIL